jgi:tetratricopeptide (TPR) repeat protein
MIGGASRPDVLVSLQQQSAVWDFVLTLITLFSVLTAGLLVAKRSLVGLIAVVLLAVSPLWLHGIFDPGPGVFWGMCIAIVLAPSLPPWTRAAALGALLGTSPLGIPLLAGSLLAAFLTPKPEERRLWASALVLSLPVACLWNPEILINWNRWGESLSWNLRLLGFLGPMPEAYIRPDNPVTLLKQGLGYALPVLVAAALFARGRRSRQPRFLLAVCLVAALILGTLWGRLGRGDLVAVVPLLAVLSAEGADLLWSAGRRWLQEAGRRPVAAALLALVVLPVGVGGLAEVSSWSRPSAEKACLQWLSENVEEGAWVALDARSPAPRVVRNRLGSFFEEMETRYLRIPGHRLRPDLYRGSHWLGWYLPFDYLVLSARTVGSLLEVSERYTDILGFYTESLVGLPERATFGGAGWRDPKISILTVPGDSLGDGWRERLGAGPSEGLQPDFLQTLGSALADVGRTDGALAALSRSLELGNRSASLYANLGALHLTRQEYKDAAAILGEGLKTWPDQPILLHNLGLAYARGGLPRRAVQVYGRLLSVAPWNDEARLDLAAALFLDGQTERARVVLEDYLNRVPPERRRPEVDELVRQLLPERARG